MLALALAGTFVALTDAHRGGAPATWAVLGGGLAGAATSITAILAVRRRVTFEQGLRALLRVIVWAFGVVLLLLSVVIFGGPVAAAGAMAFMSWFLGGAAFVPGYRPTESIQSSHRETVRG